jgi:hypothetical protein
MPTVRDNGGPNYQCRYKQGGCLWPLVKFVFLVMVIILAAGAGAVLGRVDRAILSKWTGGWSDKVLEQPPPTPDTNSEVLSRLTKMQAEIDFKMSLVRQDIERLEKLQQAAGRTTQVAEPTTTPPPKPADYSGYVIDP